MVELLEHPDWTPEEEALTLSGTASFLLDLMIYGVPGILDDLNAPVPEHPLTEMLPALMAARRAHEQLLAAPEDASTHLHEMAMNTEHAINLFLAYFDAVTEQAGLIEQESSFKCAPWRTKDDDAKLPS